MEDPDDQGKRDRHERKANRHKALGRDRSHAARLPGTPQRQQEQDGEQQNGQRGAVKNQADDCGCDECEDGAK